MNLVKTVLTAACATMALSSGLAMANNVPKATIVTNSHSKTLIGTSSSTHSTRSKTWHYGEVDDSVVFSANISIANRSQDLVYTTVDFRGMNIHDASLLRPHDVIDNITTNFPFTAMHLSLKDSYGAVFFEGDVYPNTHFTIRPVDTVITLGARAVKAKSKLQLVQE